MWLKSLNIATEALVVFAVCFGPWAFGSTEMWSTWVLNYVGFALGGIWLCRNFPSIRGTPKQPESTPSFKTSRESSDSEPVIRKTLLILTGLLLLYCLIGAVNSRATYYLWHFKYQPSVAWLPHSYDQRRSWDFFWNYLALAGYFWGGRDWLLQARTRRSRLPSRLQRLLWVLAANGAILALVSLIQHVTGQNKLLWLLEPEINKTVNTQFGPYAYHANGAQYFNLLWPVVLAFWVYLQKTPNRDESAGWVRHRGNILLGAIGLMAVCPLFSLSRAGIVVLLMNLVFASAILWMTFRSSTRLSWFRIILGLAIILGIGALFEWDNIVFRFGQLSSGYVDRANLYVPEWQMAVDNQPFGVGAGAFSSMYQFYRPTFQDAWWAQAHNDWLEALITVGWVGLLISLLPFALILLRYRFNGGIKVRFPVITLIWVALGGCLVHAWVDFPFQVESILVLFTLLCSLISVLSRR